MDTDDERSTISIELQRLAVPIPKERVPTYEELGLASLIEEATEWQTLRAGGWFWGWSALIGQEGDRWVELALLIGSVGESVLLAAAAEVEIEALRRGIKDGTVHRYYGMSQRFFAEAEGQFIMGAGHRLANIVARALMADRDYPWGQRGLHDLAHRFPARAEGRGHWVPMARSAVLVKIAEASPHDGLKRMARAVAELYRHPVWQRLEDQRGVDFHRWRAESPFFTQPTFSRGSGTATFSEPGAPAADDPTPALFFESICQTSRAALDRLLRALQETRAGWLQGMSDLSKGGFTFDDKGQAHIQPPPAGRKKG